MPEIKPGEGYVKFSLEWNRAQLEIPTSVLGELNRWREILYDSGLVGAYSDGIGYGNLSMRNPETDQFYITGSATGGIAKLEKKHYALVRNYDIPQNTLSCTGEVKASSESMSHAAIYCRLSGVQAVFHIHSKDLWNTFREVIPTTSTAAEYGTPEMARELGDLAADRADTGGIVVMGGHEDGIVSYGRDASTAGELLLDLIRQTP